MWGRIAIFLTLAMAPIPAYSQYWHDWQVISAGTTIASSPSASSWGPNRLDVFARRSDGVLLHIGYPADNSNDWGQWQALDSSKTMVNGTGPFCVSWTTNRIDCFIQGQDSQLWHIGCSSDNPAPYVWASASATVVGQQARQPRFVAWHDS
jgi:hypothetical protein